MYLQLQGEDSPFKESAVFVDISGSPWSPLFAKYVFVGLFTVGQRNDKKQCLVNSAPSA